MITLLLSDPDPQKVLLARQALALLIATAISGVLLVACVALILALRRGRSNRSRPQQPSLSLDAWTEAGRRTDPPEPGEHPEPRRAPPEVEPAHPGPTLQPVIASALGRPVVLITGGARRVGLATAHAFARAGCDLILTYRSSRDEAEQAAAVLRGFGVEVATRELDLDNPQAVTSFSQDLANTGPRLDVIVHNASIYSPTPAHDLTAETALSHYRVNALAPLLLSARLAPLLSRSPLPGGGAIVAMGDIHATGRPRRDFSAYSMSKAALIEMVQSLARDLAPRVRVNAVAPGVVAFPESGYESDPEMQARYLSRVPLARSGTPGDAAETVRWLALEAHYVTGVVIRVDGGRWLA